MIIPHQRMNIGLVEYVVDTQINLVTAAGKFGRLIIQNGIIDSEGFGAARNNGTFFAVKDMYVYQVLDVHFVKIEINQLELAQMHAADLCVGTLFLVHI